MHRMHVIQISPTNPGHEYAPSWANVVRLDTSTKEFQIENYQNKKPIVVDEMIKLKII